MLRAKLKAKFGKDDDETAATGEGEEELTEETKKRERHVVNVLRKVRNKMIHRRLDGEVCLSVTAGLKTSNYSCEVTSESIESVVEEDEESSEKASSGMASVDVMLNSLEKKAHSVWAGVEFASSASIGTDISFGFTLGPLGIAFQVSVSAGVPSLIESFNRRSA